MHARDAAFWVFSVSLLISVWAQPGLNGDAPPALAPDSPATLPPGHGRPEDVRAIGEVFVANLFCIFVSICAPLAAHLQQDGHDQQTVQQTIFASLQRQAGCRPCCLQPHMLRVLLLLGALLQGVGRGKFREPVVGLEDVVQDEFLATFAANTPRSTVNAIARLLLGRRLVLPAVLCCAMVRDRE